MNAKLYLVCLLQKNGNIKETNKKEIPTNSLKAEFKMTCLVKSGPLEFWDQVNMVKKLFNFKCRLISLHTLRKAKHNTKKSITMQIEKRNCYNLDKYVTRE